MILEFLLSFGHSHDIYFIYLLEDLMIVLYQWYLPQFCIYMIALMTVIYVVVWYLKSWHLLLLCNKDLTSVHSLPTIFTSVLHLRKQCDGNKESSRITRPTPIMYKYQENNYKSQVHVHTLGSMSCSFKGCYMTIMPCHSLLHKTEDAWQSPCWHNLCLGLGGTCGLVTLEDSYVHVSAFLFFFYLTIFRYLYN